VVCTLEFDRGSGGAWGVQVGKRVREGPVVDVIGVLLVCVPSVPGSKWTCLCCKSTPLSLVASSTRGVPMPHP
jgi:hypothetical protein